MFESLQLSNGFLTKCYFHLVFVALHSPGSFSTLACFAVSDVSYSYSACLLNPDVLQNSVYHFFQSVHSPWAVLSIPKASTLSKLYSQLQNASLWLKILHLTLAIFSKCLSTRMSHNHLKFQMTNIHNPLHVIYSKLSLLRESPMLSLDWHYSLPNRPSKNSVINLAHFPFLTCVLLSEGACYADF